MPDTGHELTEKILKKLEKDIAREYATAQKEMNEKLIEYLTKTEEQRKVQESLYKAGEITKKEYSDWCYRHMMIGKRWEEMRDVLAADYEKANAIALKMAREKMPDVYALNTNYATYQIENSGNIDTGFTLYNHDTAEYLLEEERQLMPGPSTQKAKKIAANKDLQWNKQKIQSAVLQGVLQGESPYEVARRLQRVGQMNYNSAVRYARTMTTNSQNAGRYQAYRRAKDIGVDLTIEWQATLDGRTRHEHRMMHGQRRDVDEPFEVSGVKILYPGQAKLGSSNIPQELIWNCRCTLLSWVKGFEGDTVKYSPKMGDMSFEEWQEAKPVYTQDKRTANFKADKEQFERYKSVLGNNVPEDIESFQKIKYNSPRKWEELKKEYRSVNGSRQRREKRERLAEIGEVTNLPQENPETVSWVKRIVGNHSRDADILSTNPNYSTGLWEWENNCQRCVTTYEARRRGFDVTALPCYSQSDLLATGNNFALPYERGNRKVNPLWYEAGKTLSESKNFTMKDCLDTISTLMDEYGNGSRAIISGYWNSNGRGHVFVAENVGGKVQFFDPQNGDMNCASYFDRMGARSLSIFRVDDLPFNSNISEVFRNYVE